MLVFLDAYEKTFLGKCVGIGLKRRGVNDSVMLMDILIEDDESWYLSEISISNYWINDFISVLNETKKWLENNCDKTKFGEYCFK